MTIQDGLHLLREAWAVPEKAMPNDRQMDLTLPLNGLTLIEITDSH
jgi:hypothetical protein